MEESQSNINEIKSPEINSFVYATNICVVIILCLCVATYFVVENNLQISNSVCREISHNANLLNKSFLGLIFLPNFLAIIIPKKYKLKEVIWWKTLELIGFVMSTLYLPVYLVYLIVCEKNL